MKFRKIVNDPVYGFITFDDHLIYQVLSHPFYQRLRRIHQMASQGILPRRVHYNADDNRGKAQLSDDRGRMAKYG